MYEDGDSSGKINDNVQPQYKPHALFDKYRDFESFDIYGTRAYYDQPVKVTASFSGKMLFSILPIGSDALGKKVKINLRMVLNRVLGQASPLKEVVIGEEGATGMLEIPYDKTSLVGYIEKGQNTTVTIRVEFTFDSDVPAGSCKIGFSEEMTCNIHFGNQDGSQDRFYYKYASVTDAVFSMRTGTYTGTEFKINKNGIIPLYGEVNGDTGETEEDVAMFNKGARYKISCYRTDSDNAKLPLYTDGKSPSITAGTEFVILNIVMPESYVTMAENTLEKAALDYLSRYDHENRTVSLDISSGFVAEHPNLFIDFIEGNMLKVRDDGIGVFDFSDNGQIVDMQLQIQSLEIKYSKENMFPSYSYTIARRKILSFYERLAQENQTASTQNTTNVTLGGSGTGSGTNIFSEQLLNDLIASFQKFNGWFEWDEVNQALRCKSAFYTNQWISALGAQSGSGEPGGGEGGLIKAVYGFADLGKTFDDSNLSNTFNAYTINEIWKLAKEGGMNTDKLWQELGKDDPTKKIHISHIPDNKFVTLDTEQTVTASKIFTGQLSTANVVPSVNNASTLGLESKRWENIYAVDANISGTVKTQALQVGDIKIIYDSVNKAVTFEHIDGSTEIGFYTRGWISALGVSPGGSGGSGGDGLVKNVYGFSNLGTTFSDSDLDNTFNAYTINEIWKMAKEGGGIKNITQSGSGNAVTDMTLSSDGKTITAVFGETFARQQDFGTLNNTVTQLSNKLNNFLEGSDADNIINKWKELEAFLDGLTESDNLAELLALKADKTITISAGTGLTGGGNLSANRTLSLATTGVKAGTYTKVTVDTYGRVTVGDNPTTLAGYGITDAVTLTTAQTISGRKTFSQNIVFNNNGGITYPDGNVALRNSDGHTILASFGDGSINLRPNGHNNTEGAVWINKVGNVQAPSVSTNTITIGDAQLVYDSANKALRVKHRTDGNTVGFYSDGWVSALGVKTGGSGGGSGVVNTVYSFANLTDGTTFSDSDLDNTFNAYTIKKLYDMAGQGGLDADAMWAELKKADSSKVIDASHIPTSVLDGRWVKKAGDTMTGTLTSASTSGAIVFKGVENCDITNIYKDNGVIRNDDGGLTSIRNGLRFNWYDTYWYIGNLRGSSTDSAGFGVVDHNNKLVLRVTPNDVRAPRFMSTVATGLSPLIVSSNTLVNNLNADLLDGYHQSSFLRADGVNQYVILSGGDGNNEGYRLVFEGTVTGGWSINSMTLLVNSRHAGTGMISIVFHTTNQESTSYVGSLNYYGSTISLGDTMWRLFYNTTTKKVRLFWRFYDYSDCQVSILNRRGIATNISNRTWYTTIPSDSGSELPAYYNWASSAHALATSRTLWGQPFNGTANVSGDMTGVGSINMSGQLTSTVASGTAPFIVASNTVVGNLNADLLDGFHENSFLRSHGVASGDGASTLWSQIGILNFHGAYPDGVTLKKYDYGAVVSMSSGHSRFDLYSNHKSSSSDDPSNGIQYRSGWGTDKRPWRMLLDNVNYASYSDGRYVKKAGDTMTGALHLANGTRNNAGDDCGFGNCNIAGCLGLQGLNGATGLAFIQQGASWSGGNNYKFTWNGSNMVSSSTALWNNLNADMLDNWHLNFLPRNYNIGRCYAVKFALGGEDNGWKKIFACSESGATPYRSVTVWGRIWYAYGNHAQSEVWNYHFCAIFYMRSSPSSSDSSVGNVVNSARLYLPTFAKGMDNIRLVRVGTNNFELQVRQIGPYHNANIEYQYWSYGCNVSAWENLQSTSNTSVAVSAGGASTLADSRASSADVWTTARTFYIQDHDSSHTGAGVNVNGGSNVYLKLPSSIQCSDWFRSTGNSGWYHQNYGGGIYMQDSSWVRVFGGKRFYVENGDNTDFSTATAISTSGGIYARKNITSSANIIATGAITAKASSSDIRLKTDIQDYDAMGIIRKFQSVKYHWNNLAKRNSEIFNHKKWNYGLIAQDLLSGGYSQWVSDIFKDYYTIDYERLIPVVWKGLQEVDDEVTRLKKRVRELEKRLGINN